MPNISTYDNNNLRVVRRNIDFLRKCKVKAEPGVRGRRGLEK